MFWLCRRGLTKGRKRQLCFPSVLGAWQCPSVHYWMRGWTGVFCGASAKDYCSIDRPSSHCKPTSKGFWEKERTTLYNFTNWAIYFEQPITVFSWCDCNDINKGWQREREKIKHLMELFVFKYGRDWRSKGVLIFPLEVFWPTFLDLFVLPPLFQVWGEL